MATKKPKDAAEEIASEPESITERATAATTTGPGNWRDPNYKPAEGDNSIDARMKRLTDEIRG